MIMADISNNQDVEQDFAYFTQVTNDDDVVVSLSWLNWFIISKTIIFSCTILDSYRIWELFTFRSLFGKVFNPEALSPPYL